MESGNGLGPDRGARRGRRVGIDLRRPSVPWTPAVVLSRPRLDALLDEVPRTPLTLVVAPAGTGKSTAVSSWANRRSRDGLDIVWLDPSDTNDLSRHLHLGGARPDRQRVIVVDDADLIPPEGGRLLAEALEEVPGSVRIVTLSRREPDFVPAALVLAAGVRSVRYPDLRFDDAEAAELVRIHHPGITDEGLATVTAVSNGWAAALVLTATTAPHSSASHAALAGVGSAVLDALPHDLCRVLLATCRESEVTAENAVVLSGLPEAPRLLDDAAADGLVVAGHGDPRLAIGRTWRLHAILADLLRRRTEPGAPDHPFVVSAHTRAALHHRRLHHPARAVRHAALADDPALLISVLHEFGPELMSRDQGEIVIEGVRRVSPVAPEQATALHALEALALRWSRQFEAAKTAADRAFEIASGGSATHLSQDTAADLAILDVWQAHHGLRPWREAVDRAAHTLGCRHDVREPLAWHDTTGIAAERSAWLMVDLARLQMWVDDLDAAAVHATAVDEYARQVDVPRMTAAALSLRACLEMIRGSYRSAHELAQQCVQLYDGARLEADTTLACAHVVLGVASLHELRLADAQRHLDAIQAGPRSSLDPFVMVESHLLSACVLLARGEIAAARRLLDSRGEVPERLSSFALRQTATVRLLAAAASGDALALEREIHQQRRTGHDDAADFGTAVASGLQGDPGAATRQLTALLATRPLTEVATAAAEVARVAFLLRAGAPEDIGEARRLVPHVLAAVATQRLLWILSLGQLLAPAFTDLLAAEASANGDEAFAAEALRALATARSTPDSSGRAQGGRVELTRRELDVVRELALGGNNVDIANGLFVSENTVKTHLASIYRKLGVESRGAALRAARARGLL